MSESVKGRPAKESDYHIPEPLKEYDIWVLWAPELGKTARAPWQSGHMYPAEWAETKPVDPRTDYDTASSVASLPTDEINRTWPFPDTVPQTVKPGVLIPPKSSDNNLLFVDFDDVRDAKTGKVSAEVWELVESLGGYTEISSSGQGLHVWVRGYLPDGYGKFIEQLDGSGQVEMYDRGRMTGGTWRHVEGTPKNTVPNAQKTVNRIIDEYETEQCSDCGSVFRTKWMQDENPSCPDCGSAIYSSSDSSNSLNDQPSNDTASSVNEYYQIRLKDVADRGAFRRYRNDNRNPSPDKWQGPHPSHGGTSTEDESSTNFNVDGDGVWYCFAHGDGGGSLELIAVMENVVRCGKSDTINRRPVELLRTCLYARDEYGVPESADPPYDALLGVAEFADLTIADEENGKLGRGTWRLARSLYDELDAGEF